MKKYNISIVILFLLMLVSFPVIGQIPQPVLKPPIVKTSVVFDPATNLFTYTYHITNTQGSNVVINVFRLDIARRDRQPVERIDALNNPDILPPDVYKERMDEIQMGAIPVVFRVIPDDWLAGIGDGKFIDFGSPDSPINPRENRGPFVIASKGIVGARNFQVESPLDYRKLHDTTKAKDNEEYQRLVALNNAIIRAAQFMGPTIGPSSLPVEATTPGTIIDFFIQQKDQAFQLKWITNKGVATALNQKLAAAKKKLQAGEIKTAINILHAFVHELEAQRGKHLDDNAFYLLKPNVEFLIFKLQNP